MKNFLRRVNDDPFYFAERVIGWGVMALLLLLAVAAISGNANAAGSDLSWTYATQYTDGSTIPAGQMTSADVQYGLCNAAKTAITGTPTIVNVPFPTATKSITGLTSGAWCFQARNTASGQASAWTGVVSKDVVLVPNAPGGFTVTTAIAYMATRQHDHYVMLPVGTVPGDVPCDGTNGVIANGATYFVVPTSVVTWYGSTRPTVVLATCS